MTAAELRKALQTLDLTLGELAQLLSVAERTVRRWFEEADEDIPGPVEQAILAWLKLKEFGLPWGPDSMVILKAPRDALAQQIERLRYHEADLAALLRRVEKRGGPDMRWTVDLERKRARLGDIEVTFYRLRDGGFSPQIYRRRDKEPDLERDRRQIEDAFYCVAQAIAAERHGKKTNED